MSRRWRPFGGKAPSAEAGTYFSLVEAPRGTAPLVALAVLLAGCTTPAGSSTTPSETPGRTAPAPSTVPGLAPSGPTQPAVVTRVVDGDTIHVDIGGVDYTVRYIGMDTPETVAPGRPVEWMGPEASAANKALVAGRVVTLERDVSETDRYGRLLRDVWLGGPGTWLLVNIELVRLGFAAVSTYPPDVKYVDQLLAAEREAREAGAGLWGVQPPGSSVTGGSCDPAYPSVCIAPPPPDLDCGDIAYRRFEVLAPDPHRFDLDHDGTGCET